MIFKTNWFVIKFQYGIFCILIFTVRLSYLVIFNKYTLQNLFTWTKIIISLIIYILRGNSYIPLEWWYVVYIYLFYTHQKFIYDITVTSFILSAHNFTNWFNLILCAFNQYLYIFILCLFTIHLNEGFSLNNSLIKGGNKLFPWYLVRTKGYIYKRDHGLSLSLLNVSLERLIIFTTDNFSLEGLFD